MGAASLFGGGPPDGEERQAPAPPRPWGCRSRAMRRLPSRNKRRVLILRCLCSRARTAGSADTGPQSCLVRPWAWKAPAQAVPLMLLLFVGEPIAVGRYRDGLGGVPGPW